MLTLSTNPLLPNLNAFPGEPRGAFVMVQVAGSGQPKCLRLQVQPRHEASHRLLLCIAEACRPGSVNVTVFNPRHLFSTPVNRAVLFGHTDSPNLDRHTPPSDSCCPEHRATGPDQPFAARWHYVHHPTPARAANTGTPTWYAGQAPLDPSLVGKGGTGQRVLAELIPHHLTIQDAEEEPWRCPGELLLTSSVVRRPGLLRKLRATSTDTWPNQPDRTSVEVFCPPITEHD